VYQWEYLTEKKNGGGGGKKDRRNILKRLGKKVRLIWFEWTLNLSREKKKKNAKKNWGGGGFGNLKDKGAVFPSAFDVEKFASKVGGTGTKETQKKKPPEKINRSERATTLTRRTQARGKRKCFLGKNGERGNEQLAIREKKTQREQGKNTPADLPR